MKPKRRTGLIITGILAIAMIAAIATCGRQYYQDRYVSSDYYAQVPASYDTVPETIFSDNGEDLGPGKRYQLTAYDAEGGEKTVFFTAYAPGSLMEGARELPKPGEYLLIEASKTLVTDWRVIDKADVPQGAREKLEG
ncbi:MAG: YxeA family protein [Coriobacteriaceae bacterium]|jgi:uncharacterized protein (TIGR01655 family)|nr:YxeA family protein [Coriobacteriaceae bacterium]